jgi:hypothetical protein
VPNGDGSYKITGTKIFISAGEHDLTENIIHLVLAIDAGRAGQAPRASRCSSCRSSCRTTDGNLGARNAVVLRLDRAQDGHPRQRHLRDEL